MGKEKSLSSIELQFPEKNDKLLSKCQEIIKRERNRVMSKENKNPEYRNQTKILSKKLRRSVVIPARLMIHQIESRKFEALNHGARLQRKRKSK